jgi:hypothetical protein
MNEYKNKSADIKISYKVNEYDKLESIFKMDFHELALSLALMGLLKGEKYSLNKNDNTGNTHTFSRTTYDRAITEFDAYFGLITILDNYDLDYDHVINEIAFDKTEKSNTSFSKLTNVKTFYGYLIAGIEKMSNEFFKLGSKSYDIAACIHDFLIQNQDADTELIDELLIEELGE